MKKQPERPVVITDAAVSPHEQLKSREIRYAIMMGVRVLCLIVGAILLSFRPPLLWLWIGLCVAGMVILPWVAVLLANDRPPKSKAERAADKVRNERRQAALGQRSAEEEEADRREFVTIDVDPVEPEREKVAKTDIPGARRAD